jgi:hypothetical protein
MIVSRSLPEINIKDERNISVWNVQSFYQWINICNKLAEFSRQDSNEVVKALCYKPEGRGFDTRSGDFLIYLILPAALGPWVYSASNRNEYQKHKNYVSGE